MLALTPYRRQDIQTRWENMFESLMEDAFAGFDNIFETAGQRKTGYPRIDIQELPEKFVVDATVPGLAKDDVKIEVIEENGQRFLSIKSDKNEQKEIKRENFVRKEIHRSSFCRNLSLPDNVDEDHISANVKDGILTVELPKKGEIKKLKSKLIEIK